MLKRINLQRFGDEGGNQNQNAGTGEGNQTANAGNYTYEQLDEIANSRAEKASRAALADFFRKQGMTEDEVTSAISDFKTKKADSQPNVAAIEGERDSYKKKVEDYENKEKLQKLNVSAEFMDFVLFKINGMVTDKLPFDKAAEKFLKENPKYTETTSTYRVSTGVSGGSGTGTESKNESINKSIRAAFGR